MTKTTKLKTLLRKSKDLDTDLNDFADVLLKDINKNRKSKFTKDVRLSKRKRVNTFYITLDSSKKKYTFYGKYSPQEGRLFEVMLLEIARTTPKTSTTKRPVDFVGLEDDNNVELAVKDILKLLD